MPLPAPESAARAADLRGFQSAVLDDLGGRRARTAGQRERTFRTPPRGSVEDRWAVYAGGYVARLAEALENDYPAVRRVLGEGPFRSLVARYVAACPPRSFDLGRAGDRLAGFLEGDVLARNLPFLPDLARLEWAEAEAFVAPDAAPLLWTELTALGAEDAADLRLALVPGTVVVRSPWPVHDIRALRAVPDESVSLQVEGRPQAVLVHRRGLEVRCRLVPEDEAVLIESLSVPRTLADLQAAGLLGGDVPRLVSCFQRLAAEGLFQKPRTD